MVLCDIAGLSYRDTAKVLGLPVGAVRARILQGRQRLLQAVAPSQAGAPGARALATCAGDTGR
jgi:DNA-directed RNA polymerase specialized sigma24 family protein